MFLSTGPADPLYEFGAFVADPVAGRLYHGDEDVPLTPKSFKVLMVLVGSCGQLVDKDELFQQVWPDTFVEPNNLARNVSMKSLMLRRARISSAENISPRGLSAWPPFSMISAASGISAVITRSPALHSLTISSSATSKPRATRTVLIVGALGICID